MTGKRGTVSGLNLMLDQRRDLSGGMTPSKRWAGVRKGRNQIMEEWKGRRANEKVPTKLINHNKNPIPQDHSLAFDRDIRALRSVLFFVLIHTK
jgi:hypothetical protein